MENFELLKSKCGQELVSVLRDGEDLLLRFSDGTWLRIGFWCLHEEMFIEKKDD